MDSTARALAEEVVQVAGSAGLLPADHGQRARAVDMVALALDPLPQADDWLVRQRTDGGLELHLLSASTLHTAVVRKASGDTTGLAVSVRGHRLDDASATVRYDQSGLVPDVGVGPGHVRDWTFDLGDGDVVTLRGELHVDGMPSAEERLAQALFRRIGPRDGSR
jgi:hypothetical protein